MKKTRRLSHAERQTLKALYSKRVDRKLMLLEKELAQSMRKLRRKRR